MSDWQTKDLDLLGCPTDADVDEITRGATKAEAERFKKAALVLSLEKLRLDESTPWRQLIARIRELEPRWVVVEIINGNGEKVTNEVYVNRGVGLGGVASILREPLLELSDAWAVIENPDPSRNVNDQVISHVQSINGKKRRPGGKTRDQKHEEIGLWLKLKGYANSLDKKALVIQATAKFKCGDTDVKMAASKSGLTRNYRKSPR